jgi:hypothetical protein
MLDSRIVISRTWPVNEWHKSAKRRQVPPVYSVIAPPEKRRNRVLDRRQQSGDQEHHDAFLQPRSASFGETDAGGERHPGGEAQRAFRQKRQ